jgi:hypothetical protein
MHTERSCTRRDFPVSLPAYQRQNFYLLIFELTKTNIMYQYPHTIENKFGEKLVFVDRIKNLRVIN